MLSDRSFMFLESSSVADKGVFLLAWIMILGGDILRLLTASHTCSQLWPQLWPVEDS
jgi:hypothetical protein